MKIIAETYQEFKLKYDKLKLKEKSKDNNIQNRYNKKYTDEDIKKVLYPLEPFVF